MSILSKENKHLFLEEQNNTSNSFIANVNELSKHFMSVVEFNEKFTEEQLELLRKLGEGELGKALDYVSEDISKGVYKGYRKLDINLLKNYVDYREDMSNYEKLELWNDKDKVVYYKSVKVEFTDSSEITKTFSSYVNNHHQLRDELNNWSELSEKMGDTYIEIMPSDDLQEHELLRIYDSIADTTTQGSVISAVTLTLAENAYDSYAVALSKVKSAYPMYTWSDTTSALLVIANRIQNIVYAAQFIEKTGTDYVQQLEALIAEIAAKNNEAQEQVNLAIKKVEEAEVIRHRYENLNTSTSYVAPDVPSSVEYQEATNTLKFNLPRSGKMMLDDFALNVVNGHLEGTLISDSDVQSIEIDEDGRIIIITKGTRPYTIKQG